FSAQRGGGAQLNGRAIQVSDVDDLSHALVGTGFPSDRRDHPGVYAAALREGIERTRCLRWSGSAAPDPSYVACGPLDAHWGSRLRPLDVAARPLVVAGARGR